MYTNGELYSVLETFTSEYINTSILKLIDSVHYGLLFPIMYAVYQYAFNSESVWVNDKITYQGK